MLQLCPKHAQLCMLDIIRGLTRRISLQLHILYLNADNAQTGYSSIYETLFSNCHCWMETLSCENATSRPSPNYLSQKTHAGIFVRNLQVYSKHVGNLRWTHGIEIAPILCFLIGKLNRVTATILCIRNQSVQIIKNETTGIPSKPPRREH